MEIYAEYFFVENFIADGAIAALTLSLWRKRIPAPRFLCAVLLMTLYSFSVFIPGNTLITCFPVKILFSAVVVKILFPEEEIKVFLQASVTFFGAGLLMGGAVSFAVFMLKSRGFSGYGAMYVYPGSYPLVLVCIGGAFFFVRLFFGLLSEKRKGEAPVVEVCLSVGEKTCWLKGFVDTGNCLRDPGGGRPVMIGEAESVRPLIAGNYEESRVRIIPYSAVGLESGTLIGIDVDRVIIREKGSEYTGRPAVLAVYNGSFGLENGCSVIIHPDILKKEAADLCC
ncbi:MAG: sigma-E processing peptidase SpoIIGA [Bacillota bacterium]|nr:sigma-E processing peptidase SpoIIGA [Bacillota bacterium]